MIKNLLITYLFLITNVFAGLPPTTMRGQSQTLKPTTFNFQVPNKQATITAASTSLIETGNNNELENRGFEHTVVTTGWTVSNATPSSSTTRIEGSKSLSLALTGALSLSQSSTINAAQKSGVQMVASIWVNSSDVSDLQLCSLKNGSEDKCTVTGGYVQGSGWRQLTVSFLGNSTSNGLKLKSTDTTGTVLVDQAFVGVGSPIVDFTPDMVFSAKVSSTGVVSNENTDWINGNCTQTLGVFSCPISGFTVAPNCTATITTTGIGVKDKTVYLPSITSTTVTVHTKDFDAGSTAFEFYVTCQKQGADYKTSKAYVASSSDFGYTNAGAITITATTTNPTKGTVVTDRIFASRDGQKLIAEYQYQQSSGGSAGSGDYLFTLPFGLSFDSSIVGFYTGASLNSTDISKSVVGYALPNDGSVTSTTSVLVAYDATRFRVLAMWTGSSKSFINSTYFSLGSAQGYSMRLNAPIQGWTDSGVIVGSFEGIEKCATANECNDTFSAKVSATGVVSDENTDWINGNCAVTSTSLFTCTYITALSLTSPMNCSAVIGNNVFSTGTAVSIEPSTNLTSSVAIKTSTTGVGAAAHPFTLICQKTGADYKPKTAKIASSIGVPTVPGVTTQAIDTFSVSFGTTNAATKCTSSPCFIDQIGTGVSSITRTSTGLYVLNVSKTYAKLKCSLGGAEAAGVDNPLISTSLQCSNCTSIPFTMVARATGNAIDVNGTILCQGSY